MPDAGLIAEVHRLGTIQLVVAILMGLIALAALGTAVGALIAVRRLSAAVIRNMNQITPKLSPLLLLVVKQHLPYQLQAQRRPLLRAIGLVDRCTLHEKEPFLLAKTGLLALFLRKRLRF